MRERKMLPRAAAVLNGDRTQAKPASTLEPRLYFVLALVALIYAFICGLRTVADPDLFWQLATGRWVAQHHHVFSTDVFSYTAAGQPWIYPVGSGVVLYAIYQIGGYALLSWFSAAVCVGTIALLLRKGSAVTAALTIIAVPLIANRTAARAEMFTVILFAAYLSLLWENYRSGRARLWLLPLMMLAWVNLHLGFVSGLALIVAFLALDVLQMLRGGSLQLGAKERLRRAWPWFAATGLATLANPWGWGIYTALIRQNRAMAEHTNWIAEWGKAPLSWKAFYLALSFTNPGTFYLLLLIVVIAVLVALIEREFGIAVVLAGAAYEGTQHLRMDGLMACITVVLAGCILSILMTRVSSRIPKERTRANLAAAGVAILALLAVVWSVNVLKPDEMALTTFGTGLSWWFPQRAAEFVQHQDLPGEIFNTYNEGGYLVWALGPKYRDYIDGRAIPFGPGAFLRQAELLQSQPDSGAWKAEEARYNTNVIILPLNRFEPELGYLKKFCSSTDWQPVYLDEVSAVFVRRTVQTQPLLERAHVDCATAPLPAVAPHGSTVERFNAWANSAIVLAALGRLVDASTAADKAEEVLPNTSFVPWLRGNLAFEMGLYNDAEKHYLEAISVKPQTPLLWFSLATVYKHEGRVPDTIEAQRKAIGLSTMPKPYELLKLARLYLDVKQPENALKAFDEAVRVASPDLLAGPQNRNVQFQADQGRAVAWRQLGDMKRATEFDQKAVQDLVAQPPNPSAQ